jgi:putative addiction module killer protein
MVVPRELRIYATAGGRAPFADWLESLKDPAARGVVRARLNRVRVGNFGDCRPVGEGVSELRIHYGPGYRVYFAIQGPVVVVLLCAGSKRTQDQDTVRAKAYWRDYRSRQDG